MMDQAEGASFRGHVTCEMLDENGNRKGYYEGSNIITQTGDQVFNERGAGILTQPAPTGMRIGTSSAAVAKTGSGAAINTKVTGGNLAFDAGYPTSALVGSARRLTWRCTYPPGTATSAGSITEAVLVNDTIATDTSTGTGNTIARFLPVGLGSKGASDTLIVTWSFDLQGQ